MGTPIWVGQLAYITQRKPPSVLMPHVIPLNDAAALCGVDTPRRQAMLIAQTAHESVLYRYVKEIWGPTDAQKRYEPPSTLATKLGNTEPGDGKKFMGRGYIQLTGRANYQECGDYWKLPLGDQPELLELPEHAHKGLAWFWIKHDLNKWADLCDVPNATKVINGGLNGLDNRQALYDRAFEIFKVDPQ